MPFLKNARGGSAIDEFESFSRDACMGRKGLEEDLQLGKRHHKKEGESGDCMHHSRAHKYRYKGKDSPSKFCLSKSHFARHYFG